MASHPRRYDHQPSTLRRAHAELAPGARGVDAVAADPLGREDGTGHGRVVAGILKSRPHPEQGYRACLGLMRLGRRYGAERLEAACARAERLRSYSYRTVKNILASAQDRLPFEDEPPAPDRDAFAREHPRRRLLRREEENEC